MFFFVENVCSRHMCETKILNTVLVINIFIATLVNRSSGSTILIAIITTILLIVITNNSYSSNSDIKDKY